MGRLKHRSIRLRCCRVRDHTAAGLFVLCGWDDGLGTQTFHLGKDLAAEVASVGDDHVNRAAFEQLDGIGIFGALIHP